MNSSACKGRRPLIALISNQYLEFHKDIAAKLNQQLKEAGFGLICVSAGPLEPAPGAATSDLTTRNAFYDVSQRYDVAGFVILTATIGNHAAASQLEAFVKQYTHKPVVSFGIDVPGIASAAIDNKQSMSVLMEHMTKDPMRQRFVFIRGYPNMPDSSRREESFREILNEKGISVDESLVVNGNFMTADSYFAMDKLLQRTRQIDAVVAASDQMALSAVHALRKHGLSVPDDVIVSGFNDGLSSSGSLPPVTTITYSIMEQVKRTVDSLKQQIESGIFQHPNRAALHCTTRLVIRESSDLDKQSNNAITAANNSRLFDAKHFQSSIISELSTLKPPSEINVQEVVDDIVSMLVNGSEECNARLKQALQRLHNHPDDIYWWRHLHYQLGSGLQQYGTVGQSPQALWLISKTLSQIHETLWNVEASLQFEESRFQEVQFRLRLNLNASTSLQQLKDTLVQLANCYPGLLAFLCLYDNPGKQPDATATLAFQFPANLLDYPDTKSFPTKDILPLGFLHEHNEGPFIIEPLCSGLTHLGYIVFEVANPAYRAKVNSTALADNISASLWRIFSTS